MSGIKKFCFYCSLFLYAAYNTCWLIGTMFSFGKNDTKKELLFLILTFVVDIPVLWWTKKNPKMGSISFLTVLILSIWLAEIERVLNGVTLLYWYSPKLLPWFAGLWASNSVRQVPALRQGM